LTDCTAAKAWQSGSFGAPAGASESGDAGRGARQRATSLSVALPDIALPDVALSKRTAIASPAQFGASA